MADIVLAPGPSRVGESRPDIDGDIFAQTGIVFNVQRYSIHDGPGIRTTVFLKGCPLRCVWCCNPESQARERQLGTYPTYCLRCGTCAAHCPRNAIEVGEGGCSIDRVRCDLCGLCAEVCVSGGIQQIGRERTVADVLEEVGKDDFFYRLSGGGVTLSGGEPTLQPAFALALLQACRGRGFHTAMETCGFTTWEAMASLLPHLDLVLYDLKPIDPDRHREWTGVPNDLILANARRVAESGMEMIVRSTLVPGCSDDEPSLRALMDFVAGMPRVRELHLLPYHRLGVGKYDVLGQKAPFDTREGISTETLERAAALGTARGLRVQVGG